MQVTTFGRYQLLDLIGRGTTGKVFRAKDTATKHVVALKVLAAELDEDLEFLDQFRRELARRLPSTTRTWCRSTTMARSTVGCMWTCG